MFAMPKKLKLDVVLWVEFLYAKKYNQNTVD